MAWLRRLGVVIGFSIGVGLNFQGADASPAAPEASTLTLQPFSRDRLVFDTGASRGSATAHIPLSGTVDPGVTIQGRIVTDAGLPVTAWSDLATADGQGRWSGTIAAPRSADWLQAEVRARSTPSLVARTTTRFAAGHVLAIWQQSEHHRAVQQAHANLSDARSVTDPDALQVTFKQGHEAGVEHRFVSDADPVFGHLTAMSNAFAAARPGEKFHVVFQTLSGTSLASLLDDSDDLPDGGNHGAERRWSDDMRVRDFAQADGNLPGLNWMSWYAADLPGGGGMATLWHAALLGELPDGTPAARGDTVQGVRMDHFFTDIYDLSLSPFVIAGPHRFESDAYGTAAPAVRERWRDLFAQPDFAAVARRGMEIVAYENDASDIAHPNASSVDGYQRLLTYTALDMLDQLGFGTWETPEFDNATLAADRTHVEVWSSSGDIITTRGARSEAVPSGTPTVWGFRWDGTLATETEIVNGRVRVYWNAARDEIPDGALLTFASDNVGSLPVAPDYVWKDYPLIDFGQPGVEGIPVRAHTPQDVLGVIPAASISPDPNTNPNLAAANWSAGIAGTPGGWSSASSGWTLGGDGTVSVTGVNVNQGGQPLANYAQHVGKTLEVSFVLTTPDAADGEFRIVATAFGGGNVAVLDTGEFTPTIGDRNTITFDAPLPSGKAGLGLAFARRTSGAGTFVLSDLTLKERQD